MANGKTTSGVTAATLKANNTTAGTHTIILKGFDDAKWSKQESFVNETLTMEVICHGLKDGTNATFRIYEKNSGVSNKEIDRVYSKVSGDKITATWTYPKEKWEKVKPSKRPQRPTFLFKCFCSDIIHEITSPDLQITVNLLVLVQDQDNKSLLDEPYSIALSTKDKISGLTDRAGKIKVQKKPIGLHTISFPKNVLIAPELPTKIESLVKPQEFPLNIFNENKFRANSFIVRCSHLVDSNYRFVFNPPFFEVVQETQKKTWLKNANEEPDSVSIYSSRKVQLTEKNGATLKEEEEVGFKKDVLKCVHNGKHDSINIFSPQFWKDLALPTEYEIQGLKNPLPIRAYCPSTYKVTFKFPPPKKFDIGQKYRSDGENVEYFDKSKTHGIAIPKKFHFKLEPKEEQWGKLSQPLALGSTDKPIDLEVNGQKVTISALDAFSSVLVLVKKLGDIVDLITQSMPKAGWYATFEYKVMSGKFAYAFKWKEYSDHRVFKNMAVSLELTLLEVQFELGVGFSAFQVVGQIFAQLNGEVSVGCEAERVSPDNAAEFKIPFKAKIEGVIGARVKASVLLSIDIAMKSAFEFSGGEIKISTEEGVTIAFGLKWTGLSGTITVSAGVGKANGEKKKIGEQATAFSYVKEQTFVKELDLGKFEWPKKAECEQKYMTDAEIKNLFHTVFTKDNKLVFATNENKKPMLLDDAISQIVSHFNKVPDLDRGKRVMEGVGFGIKGALANKVSTFTPMGLFTPAISQDKFNSFCQDGELHTILLNAESMVASLKSKLTK